MSSDNYVASRFNTVAEGVETKLDGAVKKILALKPIFARILQGCVEEFADLPLEDIEHKYIEGTPSIASEAVHEDENGPVITGCNTEHKSVHEGTVTFDLKFNALVPDSDGYMQLIVNVEGQNKASYPLLKRGIYYCGRMLSAQYGTVFTKSHYEKLRKVISIWVCFAGDEKNVNTINSYTLMEKHLCGQYKAKSKHYNLIEVVTVYIGDDQKTNNKLLKMLDKIFNSRYNVAEKKRYLQDECGIAMTKEVDEMCNYSEFIRNEGRVEGRTESRLQDVRNLMDSLNLTAEKAMQVLKVSTEEQKELLPLL